MSRYKRGRIWEEGKEGRRECSLAGSIMLGAREYGNEVWLEGIFR